MIVDILTTVLTPGELEFTVTATPPLEVAITPVAGTSIPMANGQGFQWFELGDNVILRNVWVTLPFGFGQGTGLPLLRPFWMDGAFVDVEIPEFAGFSYLPVPDICEGLEFPDGLFIAAQRGDPATASRFALAIAGFDLNVSMVNVPAILVGETFSVSVHFLVEHTRPMVGAPGP